MKRFGRKGSIEHILFSKAMVVVLLAMCAFLGFAVYERYTVEREMAGRREAAEGAFKELEARKEALVDKVEYLEGEGGIEAEIRKHFDVAKKGEKVVIIVDDESNTEIQFTEGINPDIASEKPWYQFW